MHIHGFLWIQNAPDMETLNWDNTEAVDSTKQFFNKYISAWNPRLSTVSNQSISQTNLEDACLFSMSNILRKKLLIIMSS